MPKEGLRTVLRAALLLAKLAREQQPMRDCDRAPLLECKEPAPPVYEVGHISKSSVCAAGGDFGGGQGQGQGGAGGFGGSAPVQGSTVGGGDYGGSKQGDMAPQVHSQQLRDRCPLRAGLIRAHRDAAAKVP